MRFLTSLFVALLSISVQAQSTKGITGMPDTSYTNFSAYQNTVKTHPEIRLVEEAPSKAVLEKRNIIYCERGARKLQLDAFVPAKKQKETRTAILIIHGGGWRSGNRTQHHPLAQRLASLGYVCFTPEYRLSTETLYPAAVHDLKAAVKWVRSQATTFGIDTGKIAVAGFSAGGELAAFLGSTNGISRFEDDACNIPFSSRIQAVINLDGILSFIHPESGEGDDSRSTSAATYWFGFSKKENPQLWEDASSLTHAGAHTPPVLLINSSVNRMHAGRDDFRKILDKHGIYSEAHSFAGAPHSFPLFHPWFEPTVGYIDQFLKKVFALR